MGLAKIDLGMRITIAATGCALIGTFWAGFTWAWLVEQAKSDMQQRIDKNLAKFNRMENDLNRLGGKARLNGTDPASYFVNEEWRQKPKRGGKYD